MSTISITATGRPARVAPAAVRVTKAPAQAKTRLRMTTRGRRLLMFLIAAPLALGIGVAVISGGSALASRVDTSVSGTTFETVTVLAGDTLWSIAENIAPQADPRDVIDGILKLNVLSSSAITPGQTLAIPAEFSQ